MFAVQKVYKINSFRLSFGELFRFELAETFMEYLDTQEDSFTQAILRSSHQSVVVTYKYIVNHSFYMLVATLENKTEKKKHLSLWQGKSKKTYILNSWYH